MSTLAVANIKSLTSDATVFQKNNGVEVGQLIKCWVYYDQVNNNMRASFNVSSVTDTATGIAVVNIDNNMDSTDYCILLGYGASTTNNQSSQGVGAFARSEHTAGSFKLRMGNTENNQNQDLNDVYAAVLGDT